jgi:hypothetical protein
MNHDPQDILNELADLAEVTTRKKRKLPTGTGPYAGEKPEFVNALAALGRNESLEEQGPPAGSKKKVMPNGHIVWINTTTGKFWWDPESMKPKNESDLTEQPVGYKAVKLPDGKTIWIDPKTGKAAGAPNGGYGNDMKWNRKNASAGRHGDPFDPPPFAGGGRVGASKHPYRKLESLEEQSKGLVWRKTSKTEVAGFQRNKAGEWIQVTMPVLHRGDESMDEAADKELAIRVMQFLAVMIWGSKPTPIRVIAKEVKASEEDVITVLDALQKQKVAQHDGTKAQITKKGSKMMNVTSIRVEDESMDEGKRDLAGEAMGMAKLLDKTARQTVLVAKREGAEWTATPRVAAMAIASQGFKNMARSGNGKVIAKALSGYGSGGSNLNVGHAMAVASQAGMLTLADQKKYALLRKIMSEDIDCESIDEGYNYSKGGGRGYGRTAQHHAPFGKSKSRGYTSDSPRPDDEKLQVRESDALQFWLDDVVESCYTVEMTPHIRALDEAVEMEDFDAFDEAASVIAEMAGLLQEYKKRSSSQRMAMARARKKPKTAKQKKAAKRRRLNYKKNRSKMRRSAAKYRKKNKSRMESDIQFDDIMDYGVSEGRVRTPRFGGIQKFVALTTKPPTKKFLKNNESLDEQGAFVDFGVTHVPGWDSLTGTAPPEDAEEGWEPPDKFDNKFTMPGQDDEWQPDVGIGYEGNNFRLNLNKTFKGDGDGGGGGWTIGGQAINIPGLGGAELGVSHDVDTGTTWATIGWQF